MRIVRAGIIAGVALALLAGATAAHGLWGRSVPGPQVQVRSGDLGLTAAWVGGANPWTPPFPGQSSDATLRVTFGGSGTTLRSALGLSTTFGTGFAPYASVQAWRGACGTGIAVTAVPSGSYYAPGDVVDLCVRLTLSSTAPAALSGTALDPKLTMTAAQRSS